MRWDLINRALGGTGRFLEIGIQRGELGSRIKATEKWGVDPAPDPRARQHYAKVFETTSDAFFEALEPQEKFDVVFIDGLHEAEQVYRDTINALDHLSARGVILLHDCCPTTEKMQLPTPQPGQWTGDCWKAIARLRAERADLVVQVANTDFGVGVVWRGAADTIRLPADWLSLTWEHFQKDKQRLLGLVSPQEALLSIPRPIRRRSEPIIHQASDPNWRVVIPSNSARRLRRAVTSVLVAHPQMAPEWIVVVDDGARNEWGPEDPKVSWVPGAKPFVYARNVNFGIKAAGPYDIIIMGDDVEVQTSGCFDLLRSKKSIVSASVVGPVGNRRQAWQGKSRGRQVSPDPIAFVCVFVPKEVLSSVGSLDTRFIDYGCEDTDFCWRAQELGFVLEVEGGVMVRHNAPGMESAFRSGPLKRNRPLLKEKWPHKNL